MAKRTRSNGEGSIYRNDKYDRWEAIIELERHPDGRRNRKRFTGRTRKEVTAKIDEARNALEAGLIIPADMTIAEYSAYCFNDVLPGENLTPKTVQHYEGLVRLHIVPLLGKKQLTGQKALTPVDVERMMRQMASQGLSPRTQNAAKNTLSKILETAVVAGLVSRNVARLAKAPRNAGKERQIKALTANEVQTLLAGLAGSRWEHVARLHVLTGLRPGELLGLCWDDINLDSDTPSLSVHRAMTYVPKTMFKDTKTARSHRQVALGPEAVKALRSARKQVATDRLAAGELWSTAWPKLVFTTVLGEPRRIDVYRDALVKVMPGMHPHRFRHTFATHLLEAGTPIHQVAEVLGDTVTTVEDAYKHVLRTKHELVSAIESIL